LSTFRRDLHVIKQFDPLNARQSFASLDYGFTHYTVCLLGRRDALGNIYIVDEHAERMWLPQRHAAAIRKMLARHNLILEELAGYDPPRRYVQRCLGSVDETRITETDKRLITRTHVT
jgi:hypothetical protein